jgi:hypothetical protein
MKDSGAEMLRPVIEKALRILEKHKLVPLDSVRTLRDKSEMPCEVERDILIHENFRLERTLREIRDSTHKSAILLRAMAARALENSK